MGSVCGPLIMISSQPLAKALLAGASLALATSASAGFYQIVTPQGIAAVVPDTIADASEHIRFFADGVETLWAGAGANAQLYLALVKVNDNNALVQQLPQLELEHYARQALAHYHTWSLLKPLDVQVNEKVTNATTQSPLPAAFSPRLPFFFGPRQLHSGVVAPVRPGYRASPEGFARNFVNSYSAYGNSRFGWDVYNFNLESAAEQYAISQNLPNPIVISPSTPLFVKTTSLPEIKASASSLDQAVSKPVPLLATQKEQGAILTGILPYLKAQDFHAGASQNREEAMTLAQALEELKSPEMLDKLYTLKNVNAAGLQLDSTGKITKVIGTGEYSYTQTTPRINNNGVVAFPYTGPLLNNRAFNQGLYQTGQELIPSDLPPVVDAYGNLYYAPANSLVQGCSAPQARYAAQAAESSELDQKVQEIFNLEPQRAEPEAYEAFVKQQKQLEPSVGPRVSRIPAGIFPTNLPPATKTSPSKTTPATLDASHQANAGLAHSHATAVSNQDRSKATQSQAKALKSADYYADKGLVGHFDGCRLRPLKISRIQRANLLNDLYRIPFTRLMTLDRQEVSTLLTVSGRLGVRLAAKTNNITREYRGRTQYVHAWTTPYNQEYNLVGIYYYWGEEEPTVVEKGYIDLFLNSIYLPYTKD